MQVRAAGRAREPLVGDRVAAHLAAAVGAVGDALEGGVDLGEVLLGLLDERADLGALVGDRRALGVVLVVGDVGLRRLDDLGELSTSPAMPLDLVGPARRPALPQWAAVLVLMAP